MTLAHRAEQAAPEAREFDDLDDTDGFCEVCGDIWDQCAHFFLNWICGMGPDGQCSLAGTEECDWECPRNV